MQHQPQRLKIVEDDLRFTEYRLRVAQERPRGPVRDAIVSSILARLEALRAFVAGPAEEASL
jgi:hypothetical protein